MWVDGLLASEELPAKEQHFGSITEKENSTEALLPVFFKQSGACVVTRGCFETMKELTPQIGRDLVVLAESPHYISTVICLRRGCDPELGTKMRSVLSFLHEDLVGKQILMILGIKEFQPYKSDSIESVRSLFEKYGDHQKPKAATVATVGAD